MVDSSKDNATAADKYAQDDSAFVKINTQRFMYNSEKCGDAALVGFLLNLLEMPPIERSGEMKPWSAFLVRTTRPTKGLDRDKNVVEVPEGADILIPATFELSQFFTKAATNENMVFEIKIKPAKQIALGGGQKMWTYDLGAKEVPKRRGSFGLGAVLARPMLPAATTAGATDTSGNEDLPAW